MRVKTKTKYVGKSIKGGRYTILGTVRLNRSQFIVECSNCGRHYEVDRSGALRDQANPCIVCYPYIRNCGVGKSTKYLGYRFHNNNYEITGIESGKGRFTAKCLKCGKQYSVCRRSAIEGDANPCECWRVRRRKDNDK